MRTGFWLATALFAGAMASAAPCLAADLTFTCPVGPSSAQPGAVAAALKPVEAAQTRRLAAIEALTDAKEADLRTDAAVATYHQDRWSALSPLAAAGDSAAMARLADDLRESREPATVRLWFALAQCAADRGHPYARDEMARWWWHQQGDGSIGDIQANRALAMTYAARAAEAGAIGAINRIGVYIAGNVHQYPAALPLAARVAELCARADVASCQQAIVSRTPYDYGQDVLEDAFWLDRLARREPAAFAASRDRAWAALTPIDRATVQTRLATWQPLTWREAAPAWATLERDILAQGATVCTASAPWCFGKALPPTPAGKPTR